jgi:hypothetical protein
MEKPVRFSQHAREQMAERGAEQNEVVETIRTGEQAPAKCGRLGYRKNFTIAFGVGVRMPLSRCWQSLWKNRMPLL